jgi:hypothetical protein
MKKKLNYQTLIITPKGEWHILDPDTVNQYIEAKGWNAMLLMKVFLGEAVSKTCKWHVQMLWDPNSDPNSKQDFYDNSFLFD